MITPTINNHYDFLVYANSILGASFQNARLVSILDYQTALKFDNVVLMHRQVFPYLPEGTLEDLTRYSYYLFKVGEKSVLLADAWIVSQSLALSTGSSHTLTLLNVSANQLSIVRDQLRLLGISFSVT